ncbi:GGDEF domain-containing response regulator [Maricaulis salignorans]|uniref:Response regulator receiver modulated diguanylate cyclase n=1 Tax=Maricaulis salignorans TaxID=144026 RepID=A0A1G9P7R5_9PROT|nr:diguanylate cyclase [Maricaulis salignorans]SDL94257.1 response regulator receiver modulated diguanylate cyclase [Maricaulis salignorans]
MGRELNVLLFGHPDRVDGLGQALDSFTLSTRTIRGDSPPARNPRHWACGVILAENDRDVADGLAALQGFAPGRRPVIVVHPDTLSGNDAVDSWIREPTLPVQIAARIRALTRLHAMEEVAKRRTAVTALYGDRGRSLDPVDPMPCVLYVGDASPRFMALQHTLRGADAEVIGAFSSYSAFDYLHERPFDAVVLNAAGKRDVAFTISSAMRRNARLYHTPVLLMDTEDDPQSAEEAYARGVSDIISPSTGDAEMRDRILALAAERRRRRRAKAALEACREPRTLDIETGLFHAAFVTSHLQDLIHAAARDELSLSVLALKVVSPLSGDTGDTGATEKAKRQFAAMLRHLLRTEDAAARIGPDTFLAILPFTDTAGIDCVAKRVAAIADCTAFESEDPLQPFRLSVLSASVDLRPDEAAEGLIERAVAKLRRNDPLAALG